MITNYSLMIYMKMNIFFINGNCNKKVDIVWVRNGKAVQITCILSLF